MELTYNDLAKKDVINVSDGKCLGRITNIKLVFPEGRIVGIFVPGRKGCKFFRWFDKTEVYIEERKIVKIGGDVILVDIRCGEDCLPKPPKPPKQKPDCNFCAPDNKRSQNGISASDFSRAFDDNDY